VSFKSFRALYKVITEMKLSLGASINQGDYVGTLIIKIGYQWRSSVNKNGFIKPLRSTTITMF
jgi:hypothetical protein